jgi:hypothetical protein
MINSHNEDRILKIYSDSLAGPLMQSHRKDKLIPWEGIIVGLLFGFCQSITYMMYATLFYFSSLFMKHYSNNPRNMFIAICTLFFAANSIGQTQQHAPDMGKAYAALNNIYNILEQTTTITSPDNSSTNKIQGGLNLRTFALSILNAVIELG